MGQNKSRWYFFSSFSPERFIDQINYSEDKLPLRVWSPYFADDLPKLIDNLQEDHFETIEIIPAKNEMQKIRITIHPVVQLLPVLLQTRWVAVPIREHLHKPMVIIKAVVVVIVAATTKVAIKPICRAL